MKRIILLVTVALVMVATMAASSVASAAPPEYECFDGNTATVPPQGVRFYSDNGFCFTRDLPYYECSNRFGEFQVNVRFSQGEPDLPGFYCDLVKP